MTPQAKASAAEVLRAALVRLGPEGERWCQRARDGMKCCAAIAISDATNDEVPYIEALALFANTINVYPSPLAIGKWNDSPSRTFPEVREAFERAIEMAEKGEAS